MKLSPERFNAHVKNMGQMFAWRQAFACPCINPASGAARPDCPVCVGRGRFWKDEIRGLIGQTNQTPSRIFATFGTYEAGDAVLTVGSDSPMYDAGQFDRFRNTNSTNVFSEALVHDGRDTILGTVESISRVFWLADDGSTIVEGGIPAVSDTGVLTWSSGEPAPGHTYSIAGVKYDEFFVFTSLPSDRNIGGVCLPKKILARKFDLFGRR